MVLVVCPLRRCQMLHCAALVQRLGFLATQVSGVRETRQGLVFFCSTFFEKKATIIYLRSQVGLVTLGCLVTFVFFCLVFHIFFYLLLWHQHTIFDMASSWVFFWHTKDLGVESVWGTRLLRVMWIHHSQGRRKNSQNWFPRWLFRVYIGDESIPSYVGIIS